MLRASQGPNQLLNFFQLVSKSRKAPTITLGYMQHTRPEVKNCNWEQFKNRFALEGNCCTIETLVSSDDLDGEMKAEQWKRLSAKKKKQKLQGPREPIRQLGHGKRESRYLERVRINSAHVLACLAKVTGEASWAENPHTFLRPFKVLVHFHEEMQRQYRLLKEPDTGLTAPGVVGPEPHGDEDPQQKEIGLGQVSSAPAEDEPAHQSQETHTETHNLPGGFSKQHDNRSTLNQNEARDVIGSRNKALEDMACYIKFVNDEIISKHLTLDEADFQRPPKIRFTDLWSMFRLGGLVFERSTNTVTSEEDTNSPRTNSKGPRVWRVYRIHTEDLDWVVDDLNNDKSGQLRRDIIPGPESLRIGAYSIDYDGDSYSAVARSWVLHSYPGEKEVTKLPVYPVRFEKDHQQTIDQLQKRGKRFQDIVSRRHPTLSYQGWSMVQDPSGGRLVDYQGKESRIPRHIDSDVIIDFHEALQSYPWWKPTFPKLIKNIFQPGAWTDRFPIILWADQGRSKTIKKLYEIVVQTDDVESPRSGV